MSAALKPSFLPYWGLVFLSFFLFGLPLAASELSAEIRYHSFAMQKNLSDESLFYSTDLSSGLRAVLGGRFASTLKDLDRFGYKGELFWSPMAFLSVGARLNHLYFFSDSVSTTNVLVRADLRSPVLLGTRLFATVGWYERFIQLSKALLLPFPFRSNAREHDFAVQLGIESTLCESLRVMARVATFEELDVLNLNNPFFELSFEYSPQEKPWRLRLFSQYRLLLGFGRLDDLTFGAAAAFPVGG